MKDFFIQVYLLSTKPPQTRESRSVTLSYLTPGVEFCYIVKSVDTFRD